MNFSSVHNYYEQLVFEEIRLNTQRHGITNGSDVAEDIACVALNKLPTRYIRYDIDLAFYLTSEERNTLEQSVREAVAEAIDYVMSRSRNREQALPISS